MSKSDTRDLRAIRAIDCPRCGARKGEACRFPGNRPGPRCCGERRIGNQDRLRKKA